MTPLLTVMLAYSIMLAVVAVTQTIRLALVREDLAGRDAYIAVLRGRDCQWCGWSDDCADMPEEEAA